MSCFQFLFAVFTLTSKEYFPILDQLESDKDS